MLNNLKALMEADGNDEFELIKHGVENDEFVDRFLGKMKDGADGDDVIKSLIDSVPEYDADKPLSKADIAKLAESIVPANLAAMHDEDYDDDPYYDEDDTDSSDIYDEPDDTETMYSDLNEAIDSLEVDEPLTESSILDSMDSMIDSIDSSLNSMYRKDW